MANPSLPNEVRKAWGKEAAGAFVPWLEDFIKEKTPDLEKRMDTLEEDIKALRVEINERFDRMNERFDRMNEQMNERFDRMNEQMNERFDRMNERFDTMYRSMGSFVKWTVGTLALFGTLITALIAIGQFV
jgi:predicted nuclease with TOPRIM domain